jgi:hypothetical protein
MTTLESSLHLVFTEQMSLVPVIRRTAMVSRNISHVRVHRREYEPAVGLQTQQLLWRLE